MTGEEVPQPDVDWNKVDREVEAKKAVMAAAQQAEAARWQGEIDTLMGRVAHPERAVEYIDLDTGMPVPGPADNTLAMPKYYSKRQEDEILSWLARKNEIIGEMSDLSKIPPDTPPDQAEQAAFQINQLAEELGVIGQRLYAALTANPLITEEWLATNPDKWRPVDLAALIGRFEARNIEVMAQLRAFRGKRNRR
jgi:hypothetical protein